MLSIRVVSTLDEFGKIGDQWNSLLTQTPSNNIFLSWEWVYTWARNYLGRDTLFILLVCDRDQVIGIAPLYIRKTNYYGILPLRQIEFLGTVEVSSCYLDFIVQERRRKQVIQRIYDYLYQEAKSLWDVLCLAEIPAESPSIDILYESIGKDGKVIEIIEHTGCPVIKVTESIQDFLNGISANERHNLSRKSKRLQQLGQVEYYRASLSRDVQKEMDAFVELHQMRWEQKGSAGSFKSRRFLDFHRELLGVISQRGWVYLDFLVLNGEKVAGQYGYSYNGTYYFYLPGLNPVVSPEVSPGKHLTFHCLGQAFREGCKEIDFLRGTADYKMAWANGLRRSVTLRLYNKNFRALAFKTAEDGKGIVKVLLR